METKCRGTPIERAPRFLRSPIGPFLHHRVPCNRHTPSSTILPTQTRRRPAVSRQTATNAAPPSLEFQFAMLASMVAPEAILQGGPTPLGRGLRVPTTTPTAAGTVLLEVDWANLLAVTDEPRNHGDKFSRRVLADWQLLHGPLPLPLAAFLARQDVHWAARLTAWLLWLRSHGTGIWQLYTQLLPLECEMTCLMNYREEEAAELQVPELTALVQSERAKLASLYAAVFSPATGMPELRELSLAPTFEDMLWAVCMVNSRCFSETLDGEDVSLMVPCADFANHSASPDAQFRFNAAQDAFQLVALRDIPPGQEVCISYGCLHKSNAELMRDYGFVFPGNPYDRISFCDPMDGNKDSQGRLPPKPSVHAGRLMAVLGIEGGVAPGTRSFQLNGASAPDALLAAQGEEAVAARRRAATFLSLGAGHLRNVPRSAAETFPEMGEDERQWERRSAAELRRRCVAQLAALPTSIETDEGLLSEGWDALGGRRWAAVVARLEVKRGLAAAAEALSCYGDSLI